MPASYEIRIKRSAEKEIRALPPVQRKRVVRAIRSLARDPRPTGCEKLARSVAWRIRVGVYRVVYSIEDRMLMVEVVSVAHRREVYRRRR